MKSLIVPLPGYPQGYAEVGWTDEDPVEARHTEKMFQVVQGRRGLNVDEELKACIFLLQVAAPITSQLPFQQAVQ